MAKEKLETTDPFAPMVGADDKVTMSRADIQNLVSSAVSTAVAQAVQAAAQGNKDTMDKLAEAILESRKPYKDPRQIENEEMMRESTREQYKRLKESLARDQKRCPHLQGSHELSDFPSPHGLTSIIQHVTDTNELIGLCTNCGRQWYSDDPDYQQWVLGKKSGNRTSSAGRRFFANPVEVMRRGRPTR